MMKRVLSPSFRAYPFPRCRSRKGAPRWTTFLPLLLLVLCLPATPGAAQAFGAPETHLSLVLQAEIFGEGDRPLLSSFGQQKDRFLVRQATLLLEGEAGSLIEYEMEAGLASCSGSLSFMLMEGGLFLKLSDHLRTGIVQGHVLRGFNLHDECTAQLTAEKTAFAKTLAPCHPLGVTLEYEGPLGAGSALDFQIGYFNGEAGSIEDDYDFNVGVILHTPYRGLSLSGYYNLVAVKTGSDLETLDALWSDGYRAGLGAELRVRGLHFRSEGYMGKGFSNVGGFVIPWDIDPGNWEVDPEDPDIWKYEDHEMAAWYAELGCRFDTGGERFSSLQPYLRYQWWDKCRNRERIEDRHEYLTLGLTLGLGEGPASLRVDYESQISRPPDRIVPDPDWWPEDQPHDSSHDYLSREADRLVVRMQMEI